MHEATPQSTGRSRFLSNTLALVLQTIFATLITLAQVKILANFLPKETFGLFASLRGLSLLLASLAAHGLPQLLVRFVPVHETRREPDRALRLGIYSVAGAAALLAALLALVHVLRSRFFGYVGPDVVTGELFLWFSATTLAVMIKLVLYGGLNGLRRLPVQFGLETASLAGALLWIIIARNDLTLTSLFKIIGIVNLVTAGIGLPAFFSLLATAGRSTPPAPAPDEKTAGGYASYLMGAVGLSLVALAFTDVDRYLLAHVLSLDLLALFHIGARVSRLVNRLLGVPTLAFQPEITRLDAEGRSSGILFATRIFIKFTCVLASLAALGLAAFGEEIIVLVASAGYVAAVPLLVLFAASLPLTTATAPITTVMKARDQVHAAVVVDLGWAAVYIGLLFVLGRAFDIIGVGVAQLCACFVQLVLALGMSNLSIGAAFVGGMFARLALAAVPAFAAVFIVDAAAQGTPFAVFLGVKVALFAAGCVMFQRLLHSTGLFSGEERDALAGMFAKWRGGRFSRPLIDRL